jgi:hypothetical protein
MKYLLIIAVVFSFFSCGGSSDEEEVQPMDTEKPIISIAKPLNNETVVRGLDLILDAQLTDNADLKELEVSISMPVTKVATGIEEPWQPLPEKINLSGKVVNVNDHQLFGEVIPADCLIGEYTLTFLLTDKADNQAKQVINVNIQ